MAGGCVGVATDPVWYRYRLCSYAAREGVPVPHRCLGLDTDFTAGPRHRVNPGHRTPPSHTAAHLPGRPATQPPSPSHPATQLLCNLAIHLPSHPATQPPSCPAA